eukprot:7380462-Pyramimonas_sp.AAC.1
MDCGKFRLSEPVCGPSLGILKASWDNREPLECRELTWVSRAGHLCCLGSVWRAAQGVLKSVLDRCQGPGS